MATPVGEGGLEPACLIVISDAFIPVNTSHPYAVFRSPRTVLGYQDSNLDRLNQNQVCCQLHHTPMLLLCNVLRALAGC